MNTLGVRSAIGSANRRKLSFRNVSNVVVQLLHTIKYSVPVPFSHLATPNSNYMSPSQNSSVVGLNDANRKVCAHVLHTLYAQKAINLQSFNCFYCRVLLIDLSGHLRSAIQVYIINRQIE